MKAFVLGAGLGTRLRPLTDRLPKPMIPVWNKPLIAWAFDHLIASGFTEFMVNTHHLPEAYEAAFPEGTYRACALAFRHEPILLETGGGIANILDWLPQDESFAVYNGDILSDLPLEAALERHHKSGDWATLVLRTTGEALQIAWDAESGLVTDIRGQLHPGTARPCYQFTGIYLLRPAFLDLLTPGKKESVIPAFIKALQAGRLGGVVIDQGQWSDLGDPDSYLRASVSLAAGGFPAYSVPGEHRAVRLHPTARLAAGARVCGSSSVGPDCEVGEDAVVERCIVWSGAAVPAGSLRRDEIII